MNMIRNSLAALLLIILMGAMQPLQAEIRAIWVLPWSTNTPEKIDAFISSAVESYQTDVFVEIRYRADAMYVTNRVPDIYPNPEPRSYILTDCAFDPLAYILEVGHKNNLRVHAWFVVFNATPLDSKLIASNYIYVNHRDWITYPKNSSRPQSKDQFGYFIDPGIPEVQDYLLNVIGDLLSGYPDLDGLHLDYIRYPDTNLGFHPTSVERYKSQETETDLTWNEWRIQQVTSFVERARALADTLHPDLILSAAVIANYHDAVEYYAQDWQLWLDNDLLDYVYPMAYQLNINQFNRQLDVMKNMQHDDSIVVGIRAWSENGNTLMSKNRSRTYNILDVAERIGNIRDKGFAGIALFSYDGLQKDNALSYLTQIAYSDKITSEITTPVVAEKPAPKPVIPVSITIKPEDGIYHLELKIPSEGKWDLIFRDEQGETVFQRNRYYLKGKNQDYWNGVLSDGSQIAPGMYQIGVRDIQDGNESMMQIEIPGLAY